MSDYRANRFSVYFMKTTLSGDKYPIMDGTCAF